MTADGKTNDLSDASLVEAAHATMIRAKARFERHLSGIERSHYSAEGVHDEIRSFTSTDDARAIDKAVEQVRQLRGDAQANVDAIRRALSPDGDTAAELRALRSWARAQKLLDNAGPVKLVATAEDLITNAVPDELGTLLQELPAYLRSRGQASDWIDGAVTRVVPEYRRARERLTKADQALQITEYNARSLHRGFGSGRPPRVLADPSRYDPDRPG